MPFLVVQGVSIVFRGVMALQNVSTTMHAGEIRGVIGPNGAGKSTLINVISRFYKPSQGTVHLNGVDLTRLPGHAVVRHGVSRTFQNLELFPAMTVLDNVLIGEHCRQRASVWGAALRTPWALREAAQARDRAMSMLQLVGLEHCWYRPARELSFGQRKLLELARALVSQPRLLLLDEPASGLSPPMLHKFVDIVLQYRDRYNMAIVLVEHVIKLVLEVCQSVTVLEQGAVIAQGTAPEIRHNPRVIKAYLGQQGSESGRFSMPQSRPGGRAVKAAGPSAVAPDSNAIERPAAAMPEVLTMQGVDSYYGQLHVLHKVSLRVHQGEIVALLGGNGSGKSTLLRTISGFIRPRHGTIKMAGEPVQGWRPDRVVQRGVIHVPQGREVFPMLTVLENLRLGAYRRRDTAGIVQDLERVYSYFPILARRARQYAGFLSGGEQQMLAIGRGLMARPALLLLDEPSASLAPLVTEDIFSKLAAMNAAGLPLLLVEQNVSAALAIADYVYVLRHGEMVTQGTPAVLQQGDTLQQAYLGR